MKLVKKILISLFTIFFIFTNTWLANTSNIEESKIITQIVLTRENLETIKNWDKYIKTIDKLIKKYSNNKNKLNKLSGKISKAKQKLKNNNSSKSKNLMKILDYLDAKTKLALLIFNDPVSEIEELLEDVENFKLSSNKEKEINDKLIEIQLNLLDKSTSILENIIDDFEKLSNYEEKGNIEMNFDFDEENIWKISSKLNFNDYKIKASNFDSQIKWHIEGLINATVKWQDEVKLELKWFLDFISKDWNMYVLLKELNITSKENIKEFKEFISKLESLAKENKYIKFEDKESKKALNILKNLTPSKILADWKNILSKPFFEPYKKVWNNKYYLVPTKYACNEIKKLANKFDPFNWDNCSDSQYKDLLKEIKNIGSLYIELKWSKTIIGFEWKINNEVSLSWYVNFTKDHINEVYFNMTPDQNRYPNEWITLEYKKNNKLDLKIYTNGWESKINFISRLNSSNDFTYIDYIWNFTWYNNNFTSQLILKNKKISGDFNYESKKYKYDYETRKWEYVPWYKFNWSINWKTKNDNSISSLKIDYIWKDLETNTETLDGNFNYSYPKFSFTNNYKWDYLSSDLSLYWEIDNKNKNLKVFDFNLSIKEKVFDYNSSNEDEELNNVLWIENDDFNEIFNSKFSLKNTIISWEIIIKQNLEKMFVLKTDWK